MYDIIYNFLLQNLYNSTELSSTSQSIMGVSMNVNEWLAHSTTIVLLILIVITLVLFVKWIFRLVGGLFLLR